MTFALKFSTLSAIDGLAVSCNRQCVREMKLSHLESAFRRRSKNPGCFSLPNSNAASKGNSMVRSLSGNESTSQPIAWMHSRTATDLPCVVLMGGEGAGGVLGLAVAEADIVRRGLGSQTAGCAPSRATAARLRR